jgi:dipeptidyl aminopeptidase/acylaminoacyl peptidase
MRESNHVADKESVEGARWGDQTRLRVVLRCFALIGACLTAYCNAFCSDQATEIPASTSEAQTAAVAGLTKRPVRVADSIQMTRLGDVKYTDGWPFKGMVAKFSPDGKRFVVILKKGNLEGNTNEYSLVLFATAEVFQSPKPRVLVSLSSSSNRPAIDNVRWLDSDTILFLGEHPGEQTALFSVKCSSRELKKLTDHATSLTSFVSSPSGRVIGFSAKGPVSTLLTESVARNGIAVSREDLTDLMRASSGGKERDDDILFAKQLEKGVETKIAISGAIGGSSPSPMSLSPDGKYLLLQTMAAHISPTWHEYEDKGLQMQIGDYSPLGLTNIYQYELVDTNSGVSQLLFDAPIGGDWTSDMAWSADSKSVILSNMHLPLDVDDASELALRKAHTFLVEVKIPSRQVVKISHEDLRLVNWDAKTGLVTCDVGQLDSETRKATSKAYFGKSGEAWSKASAPQQSVAQRLPEIVLDEGMNTPPRIIAVDPDTGRKSTLMDLNPQFQNLALAEVEEIAWKEPHGTTTIKGGLYRPIDYVAGKKYPLVIQTHAWNPDKFWMDGPWTTAFAAQALAGKGFFVLQVGEPYDDHTSETPKEAPQAMAAYESAIDYLDRKGLIDRNRIGIIGFSRTLWYVTYTLTHSKHPFAAAAVADGVDYTYFQYMAFPWAALDFEHTIGAPPFGKGLRTWIKRSPLFLIDKIETPLRVQTLGPSSVLSDWSWYTGLSRLGKPVEMIYIPEGAHLLEKPWDRVISQQGDVDWFCFWLKGEEDPDPRKAEQYKRWREQRKLQEANKVKQNSR